MAEGAGLSQSRRRAEGGHDGSGVGADDRRVRPGRRNPSPPLRQGEAGAGAARALMELGSKLREGVELEARIAALESPEGGKSR